MDMKRLSKIALAVMAGVMLAACSTPPNPLMPPGQTPAFADGFKDGCQSGRASQDPVAGFYAKNADRFASDKQYAEGWKSGFSKCSFAQQEQDAAGSH